MNKLTSRIMHAMVAIAITLCPASMWAINGDVNGDGNVTTADVTALYNLLLYGNDSAIVNGDQNGDGAITAGDVTIVYRILLGQMPNIDNEETLFNRCYATLRSEEPINGFDASISSFLRSMWQLNTITTDEAYCVWFDNGIAEMNTNQWSSDLPHAAGLFYRLCANIDVCNAYLANSIQHDEAHNGEVRTLRALYHYYLMDMFGNVPYNTSPTTPTIKAAQKPRATVYNNLITELKACETMLVAPRTNTYGRIDKAAAWMLIARICLNQNVYSPSSNATYVRNAITMAKTYAKKVLDSSYQLNTTGTSSFNAFQMLFLGDNDTNGAQKEIIWPIPYSDSNDYLDYQWSGTTFLVAACASYDSDYPNGINGQWSGMLARPQFASRFGINNFSTTLTTANTPAQMVARFGDKRALFFNDNPNPYNAITEEMSFSNGVGYLKFLNMKSNGTNPYSSFASTDFPLMRYAEAILTYAEADARLNSGTCSSEALAVLNTLLQRSGASTLSSANTNTFSDLWSKEFGFEGRHRVDLIRFGKYGSSIGQSTTLWNWKGGIIGGRSFDKSKNVFAIPAQALQDNSNLTQNDGYDINYGTIQATISVGSPYGSNTVTSCTLNLTPITSTTHIIYPEYEVRIDDNANMDNYQVFDKFVLNDNVTYYNFDLEKVKIYAQQHNTSNLYFQLYSNVSGTGYAYSQVFNVDFGFDLTIKPYWLVGDCVGDGLWTNNSDPYNSSMTPMLPNEDGNFVYAGYFPAGGQFMIVSNPGSWTGVVYGGNEYGGQQWSGTGYPPSSNANINITQAGYYHLFLNAATHELTISIMGTQPTHEAMGIIGDFNSWSLDEEMGMMSYDYDNNNHDWNSILYLNEGGVKFRADYSWTDNWGGSTFPSGIAYKNGPDIPVAEGWYKVYFNDITGAYFFTPTTSPYDK